MTVEYGAAAGCQIERYAPGELPGEFLAFPGGGEPGQVALDSAYAHLLARGPTGAPVARCSVWTVGTPRLYGAPAGYVGHYAVREANREPVNARDGATASAMLRAACAMLQEAGCEWAVGPVDGSTFRRYRLVTTRTANGVTYPPFFLEPDNPETWPQHWTAAGFAPLARYHSAFGALPVEDASLAVLAARGARSGARLRPVNLDDFDAELARVYAVTEASFAHSFLYSPIDYAEFAAQYRALRPYLHPGLVWLAERDGRTIGYGFCLPDWSQAQRGETVDTVIIKTVAVAPQAGVLGLGHWLTAHCRQQAAALGFRHAIHALMHEENISTKISLRYARPMRRYTLYAKSLAR